MTFVLIISLKVQFIRTVLFTVCTVYKILFTHEKEINLFNVKIIKHILYQRIFYEMLT